MCLQGSVVIKNDKVRDETEALFKKAFVYQVVRRDAEKPGGKLEKLQAINFKNQQGEYRYCVWNTQANEAKALMDETIERDQK